jgi:iron complex outermembrane recepter protein
MKVRFRTQTAITALLIGTAAAASAQNNTQSPDNGMVETVVVTGIRGSLQRDLDIKRDSVGVVDAISAEDIGKFPDVNLAEAIMRIPGVTVTRGRGTMAGGTGGTSTTGVATEITVRGFGPTFNETLFDGRQVATGTGDRAFDFSGVSSDFVSQIDIMKTPDATMSAGAIGATVNVKFPKPFDHPGLVVAGGLSTTLSPERGKFSPNGDLLISDTFDNDRFGILLDASYSDTETRQNHINVQGWEGKVMGTDFQPAQFAGTAPATGSPLWFIQDYGIYHELENVEREQARVVLQWRPTDNIEITLNDNFSRDNDHQNQYGYSVWFNNGSMSNIQVDKNGSIVNFQQTTPTDFQAAYNPQSLQFNDYGANVKWNVNDKFLVTVDLDHADGWANPNHQVGIDADIGYGNTLDNAVLGIAVPGGHAVPYPTAFGPNNNESQFINNGIIGSHVVPMSMGSNLDTLNQAKIEGDWTESNLELKFGFQYVGEHKNEALSDDFGGAVGVGNNNWQAYAGYGPASGNVGPGTGVVLPQSLFTKSFSTKDFINGWSGSSNLPPAILQADPNAILAYLNGLNGAGASPTCCHPAFTGTYSIGPEPGSTHYLMEKTYSGFMQATLKTNVADMPLKINVGARYDITSENVTGLGVVISSFQQPTGDATSWTPITGSVTPITAEHQYQYLLPNLDMTLSVTDDIDIRFNASRTLTRPPISQLDPVLSIGASRIGDVTENGGNADLLPYLSDNLDLGAQWYYAPNSYVSADTFLKSVDNFIVNRSSPADFGNIGVEYEDPVTKVPFGTPQIVDVPYTITQPVNGPAANVYGLELAWQHVFGDSGYGFLVNGTIVGTDKPYNPNDTNISGFAVTGLADSMNMMVFYDKDGFQARLAANWQDTYLDHFGQIQNGSTFGTEPTFVSGSWNLDFSTSYDITDQVTVYAEAMNLTDATYSTHGRFSNQLLDAVDFGRKFIFGVHFKM